MAARPARAGVSGMYAILMTLQEYAVMTGQSALQLELCSQR
jgi:hypothetical protein